MDSYPSVPLYRDAFKPITAAPMPNIPLARFKLPSPALNDMMMMMICDVIYVVKSKTIANGRGSVCPLHSLIAIATIITISTIVPQKETEKPVV